MSGIVQLRNVVKDYPLGKVTVHALRRVNLTIEKGEFTVIAGPSGSGKTTLLNLIGCIDVATAGTVEVDGKETGRLSDRQLTALRLNSIGFIFQSFNLIPELTIVENVEVPLFYQGVPAADRRARAIEKLGVVGLADRLGHRPAELSGGQQQRVAIARALAMEPVLMLFDEPTSALDPEMIKEVLDVMLELGQQGMSMIVVTHEMGFARRAADRIVFMDKGRIVAGAPPREFFDNPSHPRLRQFLDNILGH